MPRFYFHLTDGKTVRDDEGEKCNSIEAARNYAVRVAKELGQGQSSEYVREHCICVTDETGKEVFRTPLTLSS
jgi:hypothetical protein